MRDSAKRLNCKDLSFCPEVFVGTVRIDSCFSRCHHSQIMQVSDSDSDDVQLRFRYQSDFGAESIAKLGVTPPFVKNCTLVRREIDKE
jgi:hypothetical protein